MKLEDEIRDALLPGAPDEETRAAWAREALDRNPAPRRGRIRPLWPMLAAAVLLTILFWPRGDAPRDTAPRTHVESEDEAARRLDSTTVQQQRIANMNFLEDARNRDTFDRATKGSWAVIVGGDSVRVTNDLDEGLAWAHKLYPEAKHRLLVPFGIDDFPSGDVVVDRSRVALATAGSWFFQSVGIEAKGMREITLDVGGTTVRFKVDLESSAPLVLPAGESFPLFEVPGRMILEDLDRNWRSFRRYHVRVQSKRWKIDRRVEVIGAESADPYAPGNWVAVRLGTHVFHALRRDPEEQAPKETKPILLLRYKEGSTAYLDDLFGRVEFGRYAQYAVPRAAETVLQRFDREGRLVEELELPDGDAKTLRKLRELLSRE